VSITILILFTSKTFHMKTLSIFILLLAISFSSLAQTKTARFAVAGECGMCKSKIEKTAKAAGATYALWDVTSKQLTVRYASAANEAKIQQAIAGVGYDTPRYKATLEAYDQLHECCKYERTAAGKAETCSQQGKCGASGCQHDGACKKDMSCCKENGCAEKACCKKEEPKNQQP
jgi:mercuric ion binding protein